MKVSLFKLGLVLTIIGIVWISFVFAETEKTQGTILLKQSNSFELKSEFTGIDIGFYRVYMPEFAGEEVFVQILDTKDNVIREELIQKKMSVGYFDFYEDGTHTIKVTNISKNQINLQVEFGNTESQEMTPAGILILAGAVTMIVISYLKIKNYKIEQPDENI
ncbi:hypothetical protein HX860_02215 [Marine Group I thaumarchaeote]|uniref:Uncharacterized protein n=1 Tax=Marine Group I thaumarchaeote TaxID=2511932 RepID=A0A7K4P4C0_9ARCH|nr:hypothetical protein [Marine Group I thaumarchaeote]NWJ57622.1 hypothetical protein [Marine Group I thaumarchaeote]NWK01653.1 hypothetical protein [Marine Group I thaumarchaeote]NWK09528.1 hypothetical protein [Marine Group I thaumarchaeote]NWK14456.1 hypothetical protein [Marine Group I thaumarchaeote]